MNNRGDFFIGNKRVSSATGQERTFDAPIPTVTGEEPSRLSVIFDEVIIKERLVVEGGKSRTILTQFDGPVTFNEVVKLNKDVTFNGAMKLNSTLEIKDTTQSHTKDTGSIITDGGVGIERNLNVGENFTVGGGTTLGNLNVTGVSTFAGLMDINGGAEIGAFKVGITTANMLGSISNQNIIIDSDGGTLTINDNVVISGDLSSLGSTNGNIRIGIANDNEIDTTTGNLTLDSAGGTVVVDDILDVNGKAEIDNVRIDGNEIDTLSGGLTLDSASGTVTIDDNLTITGDVNGATVNFSGDITAASGIFGNIRIAPGSFNNAIDTTTGNLILDSASGTVQVNDNLSVSGTGTFTGDVIAFSSSDLTMKENVSPIDNALDMISSLTGNTFDWKSNAGIWGLEGGDTGIIAQEVEKLKLPGVTKKRDDGTIGVRYDRLIPVLIEAIKELKSEINELKK